MDFTHIVDLATLYPFTEYSPKYGLCNTISHHAIANNLKGNMGFMMLMSQRLCTFVQLMRGGEGMGRTWTTWMRMAMRSRYMGTSHLPAVLGAALSFLLGIGSLFDPGLEARQDLSIEDCW